MDGRYIPRGGIFDGPPVVGGQHAGDYWGPATSNVAMVPTRIGVHAVPGVQRIGFGPYTPAYGYGAAEITGRRPTTMEALYQAETIGRGNGIFEQSVMSCPTGDGATLPSRGGIFDGPNFGQECVYTDRVRGVIPQAKGPEVPIPTDARQARVVGFGRGPDGLGRYIYQPRRKVW